MRQAMILPVLGVLVLFGATVHRSSAQMNAQPSALQAVNAVMDYRINWVADSLSFDACSVVRATGATGDVSQQILPAFRSFLTPQGPNPCGEQGSSRFPMVVRVDSLHLDGSSGRAYLSVRRGEQAHFEDYTLTRIPGPRWEVTEMRMWGARRGTRGPA